MRVPLHVGSGRRASLWIPLPPRALNGRGGVVKGGNEAAANLSSYEIRLEYVCLAAEGCGRSVQLRWAQYPAQSPSAQPQATAHLARPQSPHAPPPPPTPVPPPPPFTPIPSTMLVPTQGVNEAKRRALQTKLQSGWGTFYHPSHLAWALLPESFVVKVGLYRFSTGTFLPADGLTVNKEQFQADATYGLKAGLHSWNHSYMEISVVWGTVGDRINVSFATTVDDRDSSLLTVCATVNEDDPWITNSVNKSDYAVIVVPDFTHGRVGTVSATHTGVTGVSPGLRSTTVSVVHGNVIPAAAFGNTTAAGLPPTFIGVSLAGLPKQGASAPLTPIILSTDGSVTAAEVVAKTAGYRAREAATLEKYGEWADVKDAVQTVLAWSFMYDPKEGLVAPMYQYTSSCATGGCFSNPSINGDTTTGLFCWDGSFASYMLGMDALDLSFSNLIQIIKMRTAAGFVPSFTAGTRKTQDRSNPPVTASPFCDHGHAVAFMYKGSCLELAARSMPQCNDMLAEGQMWLLTLQPTAGVVPATHMHACSGFDLAQDHAALG